MIVAILVLAVGFLLFVTSQNQYQICHTILGSLGQVFDQTLAAKCHNAQMERTGGIGLMALGGVLLLVDLVRQKPKSNPQKEA